jgi:hypothetical protein
MIEPFLNFTCAHTILCCVLLKKRKIKIIQKILIAAELSNIQLTPASPRPRSSVTTGYAVNEEKTCETVTFLVYDFLFNRCIFHMTTAQDLSKARTFSPFLRQYIGCYKAHGRMSRPTDWVSKHSNFVLTSMIRGVYIKIRICDLRRTQATYGRLTKR